MELMETEYWQLIDGKLHPVQFTISKHGSHDQKTHGNWAIGVALEVATEIQRYTREWSGLSISMVDGHQPTDGYMVAKPPEFGKIVDEADFFDPVKGPQIMSQYMREQKADLATGKNYLGTWLKDGKIYLDVSENIMDRDEAIRLGKERNQKAIWDVVNQTEIETGGTGRVEKGNQDGGVEEPRRYDGRGDRRLRARSLEKIRGERQQTQVIRFAFGLKPVFKHGEHDQKTHGNWATGEGSTTGTSTSDWEKRGYPTSQAERIAAMSGTGPTTEDLDNLLKGGSGEINPDRARMMIDNDSVLNADVEDRIEQLLNDRDPDGEYSEEQRLALYDELREEAISDMIATEGYALERYAQENGYDGLRDSISMNEAISSFAGVFGMTHEGTLKVGRRAGESVTLASQVTSITVDGDGIHVYSRVFANNGEEATVRPIERIFSKDPATGTWSVEHEWMEFNDDYKGTGFGGKFIQQSEDWYISKGLTHINTLAGLEDGARHWANAGFDWNRDQVGSSYSKIRMAIDQAEYSMPRIEQEQGKEVANSFKTNIAEARTLLSRMADENGNMKDMRNDDFPKPYDFAKLGFDKPITLKNWDGKTRATYFGKELLANRAFYYTKALTAEGRNLLNGPIDMDGDGLVYDGTPREKPAPSGNN